LYEIVMGKRVLERHEVEHLKICEECLEMIRVFVRQVLSKGAATS
jgi:hypothetical protein